MNINSKLKAKLVLSNIFTKLSRLDFLVKISKTKQIFSCFCFIFIVVLLFISNFSEIFPTWTREKGRALIYMDTSYRASNEYFLEGRKMEANDFEEYNLNIYLDYGVTTSYTIGLYSSALKSLSLGETEHMEAVTHINKGDLDLIQRWQIASLGGAVFNAELLIGIPTGVFEHEHALPTGDGEYNYQPGFSMGWGFDFIGLASYLTLYTAMNFRDNGFSDELHYNAQWGLFLYKKKVLLSFEFKKLDSLKTNKSDLTEDGLWNNTSYTTNGVGFSYKFNDDFGLSIYYKTITKIENAIGGDIYSIGGFYLF